MTWRRAKGVEPGFVFERLLDAEKNFKRGVLSEGTLVVVLGRVGMKDEAVVGGRHRVRSESGRSGPPPHCV